MDLYQYLAVLSIWNMFKVKYIKSDYRSALTDKYLPSILMLENTNLEVQLSEMLPPTEKNSMLLILWPVLQKKKLLCFEFHQ